MALRFFVSLAPALVLLTSFWVVYQYPISPESHAKTREELKAMVRAEG